VQSRRLAIDVNILIRAVLGVRVRHLIERYCEPAAFFVAESNALRVKPGRKFRKLTDSRCQCAGCGEYFNSDSAFDKHRIGEFGKDRRCMTTAKMREAGMSKNAADWWVIEPFQKWSKEPEHDAEDAPEAVS
jgi:hypothetical protein